MVLSRPQESGSTGGGWWLIPFIRSQGYAALAGSIDQFLVRMTEVFRGVNSTIRGATAETAHKRLEAMVSERTSLFAIDNPERATREQARIVLSEVEAQLDDSPEAEAIRHAIVPITRDFDLRTDPAEDVPNYLAFLEELEGLRFAWRVVESGLGSDTSAEPQRASKPPRSKRQLPADAGKKRASGELPPGRGDHTLKKATTSPAERKRRNPS